MLNSFRFWGSHYKFFNFSCLTFQGTGLPLREKFNSNVAANGEYLFSHFYWFINLVKRENIALVLSTNMYNFSGLFKFKEKN